jgi:sialidase-1
MKLTPCITRIALLGILLVICFSCNETAGLVAKNEISVVASATQPKMPILIGKERNKILRLKLEITSLDKSIQLEELQFSFNDQFDTRDLEKVEVYYGTRFGADTTSRFGTLAKMDSNFTIKGSYPITAGIHYFWLTTKLKGTPELTKALAVELESVSFSDASINVSLDNEKSNPQRFGVALRRSGDDGIDTYRIPGLATTNTGTLIAVYDNRKQGPVDLQGNIDVGMSRSADGGQTWEPMKVIMDMGEYGGLPESQNGVGDPAVLVDRMTNTIWVAALWFHGHPDQRAWNASQPGMAIEQTGQLLLVKSEDDGITWSDPINITGSTKHPFWQLFFNGPGSGITMNDGTLVFAAQYKDADRVPYSTILYSQDRGVTWKVGKGAKSETTEAQVVEIFDGVLMINMRDDRNRPNREDSENGRSVAISSDLGLTWNEHVTSRKGLIEPNCMASILSYDHPDYGKILFFSNPNSKTERNHITIKSSFDLGITWPLENQIELYEDNTYGYSCLSLVDDKHLGILYEGEKELYFQKIPIEDLIGT